MAETNKESIKIEDLFTAGAHFGFSKSRRHPSVSPFIFGSKNRVDIFDLEKTQTSLSKALEFVYKLAEEKGTLLFIGGKPEASEAIRNVAESVGMPYVASRWIGGTLTNFGEISKRVATMKDLISQKEKGELAKYTKKERVLIDRKIEKLQKMFWGIRDMASLPKAVFIVDPRFEDIAIKEAKDMGLKVIALCGSDNNIKEVDFPITANDSNIGSVKLFVEKIGEAYKK